MIEIKCAAPETAKALCEQLGSEANLVLEMTERGVTLGTICLMLSGEEGTLLHLQAPDLSLTDALLRAGLNAVRAKGAKYAVVCDPKTAMFMQNKGYIRDLCDTRLEIADFFAKSVCKA